MRAWWLQGTIIFVIALLIAAPFGYVYDSLNPYWQGIAIESGGVVLEVLLLTILLGYYQSRLRKQSVEDNLRRRIEDFKGLDNEYGHAFLSSSLRELAKRGCTNFDLRGSRLTGFSFNREDIKSLRKSLFADGLWFDNQRNNFGYMRQIDFSSTDCSCVTFSKGNLSLASYENCIFWEADLQKADFTGATLKWDIESVVADESQWSKVIDETDTGEPIYAQEYLPAFDRADLDHTKFDKCSFEYADFRGAKNIHNASFIGARGLDTCFFDEGVKENLKVR